MHALVQLVGRAFGEQAGAGDIDVVGTQRRQPVEIRLRIRRADVVATEEFWAIQFGDDDALPDVGPTQVRSVGPQVPLVEG